MTKRGHLMFVHCTRIWWAAAIARNRVRDDPSKNGFDAITAIMLSVAAIEAFINEMAAEVEMVEKNLSPSDPSDARVIAFGTAMSELENSKASLTLKYQLAAQVLQGRMFLRGEPPFQDFATLVSLRNDVTHVKNLVEHDAGSRMQLGTKPSARIRDLQQRALARKTETDVSMSWLNTLETTAIAEWACVVSYTIIVAILRMFPLDTSTPTMAHGLIEAFQNARDSSEKP